MDFGGDLFSVFEEKPDESIEKEESIPKGQKRPHVEEDEINEEQEAKKAKGLQSSEIEADDHYGNQNLKHKLVKIDENRLDKVYHNE